MATYYAATSGEISERERLHMNLVRSLAGECMTLLENDGTLPLKKTGKIALYGNGARHTVKGGTGSGDVNNRSVATIEVVLEDAGFEIRDTIMWLYGSGFPKSMNIGLAVDKKNGVESKVVARVISSSSIASTR